MQLPLNCQVDYVEHFLDQTDADALYQNLIDEYHVDRSRLVVEAGGKMMETDSFKILFSSQRLIDLNTHPEAIHGKSFLWSGPMAQLKDRVEAKVGKEFELAMVLFYPDGNYFAPYHFDQQTSGHQTVIPSLSLGEVREFLFKENHTKEIYSLSPAHGSLLIMGDYCQSRYQHSLSKNPDCQNGRINITFREPDFK